MRDTFHFIKTLPRALGTLAVLAVFGLTAAQAQGLTQQWGTPSAEVLVYSFQTGEWVNITRSPAEDDYVGWSPDGNWLMINSYTDSDSQVSKVNLNELSPVRLATADIGLGWFPDGKQILFAEGDAISAADENGQNVRLVSGQRGYGVSLSGDGKWITMTGLGNEGYQEGVFLVEVATGAIRNLNEQLGLPALYFESWSPTAEELLLTGSPNTGDYSHIYLTRPLGEELIEITAGSGTGKSPSWSDDGQKIVFLGRTLDDDWQLFLYDVATNSSVQVIQGPLSTGEWDEYYYPSMSPDHQSIAYYLRHGLENIYDLVFVDIKTGAQHVLTTIKMEYRLIAPTWLTDSSGLLFFAEQENSPPINLYFYRLTDLQQINLTDQLSSGVDPDYVYFSLSPDGSKLALTAKVSADAQLPVVPVTLPGIEILEPPISDDKALLEDYTGKIGGTAQANQAIAIYRKVGELTADGSAFSNADLLVNTQADAQGNWMVEKIRLEDGVNNFLVKPILNGFKPPPFTIFQVDFSAPDLGAHYGSTYGFLFDNWDTRPYALNVSPILSNLGFSVSSYSNSNGIIGDTLTRLYKDSIFYFIGHGGSQKAYFVDQHNQTIPFSKDRLSGRQFPYLKLVVLNGCSMGENVEGGTNLSQTFINAGADTVVSFDSWIKIGFADIWGDLF